MPCKQHLEFPGAKYHVLSRGDRRKAIFLDLDYVELHTTGRRGSAVPPFGMKTLAEARQNTGWQVHACSQ
jgi:hypothetical protein